MDTRLCRAACCAQRARSLLCCCFCGGGLHVSVLRPTPCRSQAGQACPTGAALAFQRPVLRLQELPRREQCLAQRRQQVTHTGTRAVRFFQPWCLTEGRAPSTPSPAQPAAASATIRDFRGLGVCCMAIAGTGHPPAQAISPGGTARWQLV